MGICALYLHYKYFTNLKLYTMPNFDKTGPDGKGARTGLKRGNCNENTSNNNNTGYGQGRGFGRGRGTGFGNEQGQNLGRGGRGRGFGRIDK